MTSRLIFDVGLHKGEDSEFYLKKGFDVIAVEANPDLCELARVRLSKYINSGQLTIVNAAIAEKDGPITFFVNEEKSVWGTTSREWAERNEALGAKSSMITVEGVRFDQLLIRHGIPYYLKIDIEGADILCLKALERSATKPMFISIESNKTSWRSLLAEIDLLNDLGYRKYKLVQQVDVENQQCPFPAREGGYVEHAFEDGATGLFGEEAPGPWLTRRKALQQYRKIFLRYWLFGDFGKFYRFREHVARLPLFWRLANFMNWRIKVGWYDTHAGL